MWQGQPPSPVCLQAAMLRRLRHRNVVNFRGVSVAEGRGILIMVSTMDWRACGGAQNCQDPNAWAGAGKAA